MIVRVKFKAIVKGHEMYDYIDIHAAKKSHAVKIFKFWIEQGYTIKGNSGITHLRGYYGKIEFVKAKELKK